MKCQKCKDADRTPKEIGLEFEDIYFFSSDGTELNGWFVPAKGSRLTVLFCHGNAGRRLFEAAPEPKEFYPMRGGHNEAIFLSKKDFAARIGTFLRESCQ